MTEHPSQQHSSPDRYGDRNRLHRRSVYRRRRANRPQGDEGSPRTDLALEAAEEATGRHGAIPGLNVEDEDFEHGTIHRVRVQTGAAGDIVGKPPGSYITIEVPTLASRNRSVQEHTAVVMADELMRLLNLNSEADVVFVVGLGNWNATSDALGPEVIQNLLITRHLHEYVPEDVRGGLRPVCAMTPGVLGITGIETSEIIHGIADRIQPAAIIALDALASSSVDRILTTIQIADTGINPGSGVGNDRAGINEQALGVPVVAVGVPTVVHALTIAQEAADTLSEDDGAGDGAGARRRQRVSQALAPSIGDMMVTPKEIDIFVREMSQVIAAGLDYALHPRINQDNMMDYLI